MSVAGLIARHLGNPEPPVTLSNRSGVTVSTHGREGSNTCNPYNPTKLQLIEATPKRVSPDALLLDIAQTLQASPARLRGLLDSDDMQDIADGATSKRHLLAYFRLMRSHGYNLAGKPPAPSEVPLQHPIALPSPHN